MSRIIITPTAPETGAHVVALVSCDVLTAAAGAAREITGLLQASERASEPRELVLRRLTAVSRPVAGSYPIRPYTRAGPVANGCTTVQTLLAR